MRNRWMGTGWGLLGIALSASVVHAQSTGSVTTAPVSTGVAAPAASVAGLLGLAAGLVVAGWYCLRRGHSIRNVAAGVALAAVLGVPLTQAGAAFFSLVVEGEECSRSNTEQFLANSGQVRLLSNCPNPIHIVRMDVPLCEVAVPAPATEEPTQMACTVGLVLNIDEACVLNSCRE